MTDQITIPEHHIEFCREVTRLARKYGLNDVNGTFTPGYKDPWSEKINFSWDQGRHGDDSDRLYVNSTQHVRTRLDPDAPSVSSTEEK